MFFYKEKYIINNYNDLIKILIELRFNKIDIYNVILKIQFLNLENNFHSYFFFYNTSLISNKDFRQITNQILFHDKKYKIILVDVLYTKENNFYTKILFHLNRIMFYITDDILID